MIPKSLLWELPEEPPAAKGLSAAERKRIEEDNKRWDTIIATCKSTDYFLVEIPLVEILPSKSTHAEIGALSKFDARLRCIPTAPGSSPTAACVSGQRIGGFMIHVTATMPESKVRKGRAEGRIGRLKRQIQALLSAHHLEPGLWPHAARYANEPLQREALNFSGTLD